MCISFRACIHCLNFVTEGEGRPGAVLIRGLQLLEPESKRLEGPGKICRYLSLTKKHHGIDVVQSNSFYLLEDSQLKKIEYMSTSRIGIQKGKEKLWQFVMDVPK